MSPQKNKPNYGVKNEVKAKASFNETSSYHTDDTIYDEDEGVDDDISEQVSYVKDVRLSLQRHLVDLRAVKERLLEIRERAIGPETDGEAKSNGVKAARSGEIGALQDVVSNIDDATYDVFKALESIEYIV